MFDSKKLSQSQPQIEIVWNIGLFPFDLWLWDLGQGGLEVDDSRHRVICLLLLDRDLLTPDPVDLQNSANHDLKAFPIQWKERHIIYL